MFLDDHPEEALNRCLVLADENIWRTMADLFCAVVDNFIKNLLFIDEESGETMTEKMTIAFIE